MEANDGGSKSHRTLRVTGHSLLEGTPDSARGGTVFAPGSELGGSSRIADAKRSAGEVHRKRPPRQAALSDFGLLPALVEEVLLEDVLLDAGLVELLLLVDVDDEELPDDLPVEL